MAKVKRTATSQLTKDNPEAASSDEEHYSTIPNTDISQRKISKPKRTMTSGSSASNMTSNPFASLFGNSGSHTVLDANVEVKMKGLNVSFLDSVKRKIEKNPAANLTPLFSQYQNFINEISGKNTIGSDSGMNIEKIEEKPVINSQVQAIPFSFPSSIPSTSNSNNNNVSFSFSSQVKDEDKMKDDVAVVPPVEEKKSTLPFSFDASSAAKAAPTFATPTFPPIPTFKQPEVKNTFGSNAADAPISFGQFSNSTSAFSFTSPSTSTLPDNQSKEPSKIAPFLFSFGETKKEDEKEKEVNRTETTAAPQPFKFSFGGSGQIPSFNFGSNTTNQNNDSTVTSSSKDQQSTMDDEDAIPPGEEESFSNKRSNSDLIKTGVGEEEETCLIEDRCKIFVLEKGKGWIDLGVALVKINQNTQDNRKRRILGRAEGSGKILINSWINEAVQVDYTQGKKEFSILCVNQEGKPASYLIRLKESSSAEHLVRIINSHISNN